MFFITRAELKKLTKSQLKGNWKIPVLLTLAITVVSLISELIQSNIESIIGTIIGLIITYILASIVTVGYSNFYLKFLEKDGNIEFKDFIVSSNKVFKSLVYMIIVGLIGIVLTIICIAITFVYVLYFTSGIIGLVEMSIWGVVSSLLIPIIVIILCLIVYSVFGYGVALTPYIIIENDDLGAFKAMKLSKKIMKGKKWKLFVLHISFFGWAILSLLTLGIGLLWLGPYTRLAQANFYKEITID